MKMVNAYAIVIDSNDASSGLARICGSQGHAVNTYRELTGKPGAHRVSDPNAAAPEDVLKLDESPEFCGYIVKYSFEIVEEFEV